MTVMGSLVVEVVMWWCCLGIYLVKDNVIFFKNSIHY